MNAGLCLVGFLAWYGLLMYVVIRIETRRSANRMWQEALADKSGRKMKWIENAIKRGGPPL